MKVIKFFCALFIFISMMTCAASAAPYINMNLKYDGANHKYNAEEVYLIVNNNLLENLPMPPIILNNSTLVPAREVFEELGASVTWNNSTQQVGIIYNGRQVLLTINNKTAYVDGDPITMSIPAKNINNKTMIPLRFVSEALGLQVGWDSKTRIASVSSKVIQQVTETTTQATTQYVQTTTQQTTTQQTTSVPVNNNTNTSLISINSITLPTDNDNTIKINAGSAIEKIESSVLPDGRLVVDIHNAKNNVPQSSFNITHPFVSGIRVAQFQSTPTMITRVALDLDSSAKYNVYTSNNSVIISFEKNNISFVQFFTEGNSEHIQITGDTAPAVNVFNLASPDRLVIDLPYSKLVCEEKSIGGSNLANDVRYSQFDENTVRVVIELKGDINHTISANGNTTDIKIMETGYKNISYNSSNRVIKINKNGQNINTGGIVHSDDYWNKKYTLNFNMDLSSSIGVGSIAVDDEYISDIVISTENGKTSLVINEKQILAYTVADDGTSINIMVQKPKEKYKNVVVLDPGHGGSDPGTSGYGFIEKNLALDIVNKTIVLMENDPNIKVYATRITDVYPTLSERPAMSNPIADIFVSVHINSADKNPIPNGTEVHYFNPNTNSSGLTSNILASTLQKNFLNALGSKDRGLKSSNFQVLRESSIPAVLCEIGFVSNPEEAAKLGTEEYRQKTAEAIAQSLREIFETYPSVR